MFKKGEPGPDRIEVNQQGELAHEVQIHQVEELGHETHQEVEVAEELTEENLEENYTTTDVDEGNVSDLSSHRDQSDMSDQMSNITENSEDDIQVTKEIIQTEDLLPFLGMAVMGAI